MKRIATAAVAATLSLTAVANPAFAAEEKVGSSEAYRECTAELKEEERSYEDKAEFKRVTKEAYGSSTPSGVCIKWMTDKDSEYRSSVLGLLIGVPVALIALIGAAAAFSGAIPGVQLPALPF